MRELYHVCEDWDGGDLKSLYRQHGDDAYDMFAEKWPEAGGLGDYHRGRRKAGAVMSEYVFKANNSSGVEYSIKIKAGDFFTARDRAQDYCYRCGLCFLGRA